MKFVYALKIIADICFYFTFANFIATVFSVPPAINLGIPIVYMVYSILSFRKFTGQFDYASIFILYLKLFLPFAFFAIIFTRAYFEAASLPFALAFFISAVILMRITRHHSQVWGQLKFNLIHWLPVSALLILGVLVTSRQMVSLMGLLLSGLYFNVIVPILMFLGFVIAVILSPLVYWLSSSPEAAAMAETLGAGEGQPFEQLEVAGIPAVIVEGLWALAILAMILLAAYLLMKLFRKLTEYHVAVADVEGIIQTFVPVTGEKDAKRQKQGQARQLRKYYRKFLQLCWKNGMPSAVYMTSADYEQCAVERFGLGDEAAALRDIYLPARYGGKAVTNADIVSMRKWYKRVKAGFMHNYTNAIK